MRNMMLVLRAVIAPTETNRTAIGSYSAGYQIVTVTPFLFMLAFIVGRQWTPFDEVFAVMAVLCAAVAMRNGLRWWGSYLTIQRVVRMIKELPLADQHVVLTSESEEEVRRRIEANVLLCRPRHR